MSLDSLTLSAYTAGETIHPWGRGNSETFSAFNITTADLLVNMSSTAHLAPVVSATERQTSCTRQPTSTDLQSSASIRAPQRSASKSTKQLSPAIERTHLNKNRGASQTDLHGPSRPSPSPARGRSIKQPYHSAHYTIREIMPSPSRRSYKQKTHKSRKKTLPGTIKLQLFYPKSPLSNSRSPPRAGMSSSQSR